MTKPLVTPPIMRVAVAIVILLSALPRCLARNLPEYRVDLTNPASVKAVVAPFIERERADYHIPGAVFVLVCNGRVTVCEGFGQADIAKSVSVDPERTIFPVGSLSKVVTAMAIMQLAQGGKLDLNADINSYLAAGGAPFRIESDYALPITAARLLTHSSGMEDPHIGLAVRAGERAMPLGEYLAHHRPQRVMPPDDIAGYCSEGFSLLGYLVELRMGMPFETYVERFIFGPLGMTHTTFRQPPPLLADRAIGYDVGGAGLIPIGDFYVHGVPAAGMTTTAADMGRLLGALLQDFGDTPSACGLSPESIRSMFVVRFRNAPRASGWTYGFHGATDFGERRVEHGGLYRGYTSKLVLLPDRHAGFFAAYNRCEAQVLPELDGLFAVSSDAESGNLTPSPAELQRFAGVYRASLYPRHSVEAIGTLLSPTVVAVENDRLTFSGLSGVPLRCVEPGYFVRSDGKPGAALVFRQDVEGVMHLVYGGDDFESLRWYGTGAVQLSFVVILMLVLVPHCVLRPLPNRWVGLLGRGACMTAILFLIATGCYIRRIDQMEFLYGIPKTLQLLLAVPWVVAGLVVGFGLLVARAWGLRLYSMRRRVQATAVLAALIGFLGLVYHWNLVVPFAG